MAKDSVKKRLTGDGEGMSFTEFTYQLVQGYDFLHLFREYNCRIQMGGSDQWGNITTGTELIRRKAQGEAFAITCPLITKADGGKFGKTEEGNIWLSSKYTSPYKFYQFWLNTSDDDAEKYIKIFTLLAQLEINSLIESHRLEANRRQLQNRLAEEVTIMVHGQLALDNAIKASNILFGKSTENDLRSLDSNTLLDIFSGVPQFEITQAQLAEEPQIVNFLAEDTQIFSSKGEARKMVQSNGVSINKSKVTLDKNLGKNDLISGQFILAQKGKKNYFLVKVI